MTAAARARTNCSATRNDLPIQLPCSHKLAEMAISSMGARKSYATQEQLRTPAMPAAKQWACTTSEEVSGAQSSSDLRQLRTSCQERNRESDRGCSWFLPARYSPAVPAPCGVTMYGRMPAATCPSTTGSTSRAYSHAWSTRHALVRLRGVKDSVCRRSVWRLELMGLRNFF